MVAARRKGVSNLRPESLYAQIKRERHQKTILPQLRDPKTRKYTIKGLSLCFFLQRLDQIVTKQELIDYLARYGLIVSDPQPRHLGLQYGFYFLIMGSWHPKYKRHLKQGEYCLRSIKQLHPSFRDCIRVNKTCHRTKTITPAVFTKLKKQFSSRCSHCGSMQDAPHLKNKLQITKLEMGHMDPQLPLTQDNCIPMCSMCNRVYKNKAIFNKRGFIIKWLGK